MARADTNRFQDFFVEDKYVFLKNHLYNYLLRKRAIEKTLAREAYELILEVGSGISPVMTRTDRIVYSELSFLACRTLKRATGRGGYVVADATRLPFKREAFSHTIKLEVLEHVEDDRAALRELARVMKPGGRLIVTFPHRACYFANDDRYVNHYRRYELADMIARLGEVGLCPLETRKILGPLEKLTMMFTVVCFEILQKGRPRPDRAARPAGPQAVGTPAGLMRLASPLFQWANRVYACLAWLDARVVPRALATVLLIRAEKSPDSPPHHSPAATRDSPDS